jgi:predicted N-acetyltransferase YhbS
VTGADADGIVLRWAAEPDFPALHRLAQGVMIREETPRIAQIVPILMRPDLSARFAVAVTAAGEVVSMVGSLPYTVRSGPVRYRAAGVGIVATHPQFRRRGLAGRLLAMHYAALRAQGVDLAVISGNLALYDRSGAAAAGWGRPWTVAAAPADEGSRLAVEADLRPLAALWAMEAVTVERSWAHWQRAFGAVPRRGQRQIRVVGRPAFAYAVLDVGGKDGGVEVRELAGGRLAALGAARTAAAEAGVAAVRLWAPHWDRHLAEALAQLAAVPGAEGPPFGRYLLTDPARLLSRLTDAFSEMDPALDLARLERACLERPDRGVGLLFGPDGAAFSPALPLPLPRWEGLNYV